MEISKKVYIKGEDSLTRLKNLEKIAQERYHGNFSEMVNDCLNKAFHLDPSTGEHLKFAPPVPPEGKSGTSVKVHFRREK